VDDAPAVRRDEPAHDDRVAVVEGDGRPTEALDEDGVGRLFL
jgi:hypothetical protein